MRHQRPEPIESQVSLTDVLVTVAEGPERHLGVVRVDGGQPREANLRVEFGHGGAAPVCGGEVVAHRIGVTGVDAGGDAGVTAHRADDGAKFPELAADAVALPGVVFEDEQRRVLRLLVQDLEEHRGDAAIQLLG